MSHRIWNLLLPLLVAVVSLAGCDKASPVAPSGTILTVSANPSQVSLNGQSTITVVGRKPDGNPLNPGTEVRFSAERGSIEPIVETGNGGVASAVFRADGRAGAVKITVRTGSGDTMAEISVQVGQSAEDRPTVRVSASPNNVPVGGTSTITVIARTADGSPLPNQTVILTTSLGSLVNSRPVTGSDGTVTTTLRVGNQAGSAEVVALVGSSEPGTATVTIRDAATDIAIQANPSSVPRGNSVVTLTAFVTNSQGQPLQGAPVTFDSERGNLETLGVVFTDSSGVATNDLTLVQADLPPSVTSFKVTASTPSGNGQLIDDETTINVN